MCRVAQNAAGHLVLPTGCFGARHYGIAGCGGSLRRDLIDYVMNTVMIVRKKAERERVDQQAKSVWVYF
jgi:hypothetical protein